MLLRDYLRRQAGGLLGWCLTIPVVVLPMVGIYRLMMNTESMRQINRMLEQMPPALRAMIGGDLPLDTLDAWVLAEVLGLLIPLLLTVFTALTVLGVLTREIDGGTMTFLLTLPVRRSTLLLSRLGGLFFNLALLHGVVLLSVVLGVTLASGAPGWSKYGLIVLNQYLIFAALAALLLVVTVLIDDLQKGLITTLSLGLLLFFLPHMTEADSPLRRLTPFGYYQPQAVLAHGALPWSDVLTLLGVLAIAVYAAVQLFGRKQLSA